MTGELARLIAAQVCIHANMAGMRLAAPLLALREGYSPVAVGVLLALFALAPMFLALPVGRYTDRHGLKRPMAFCVVAAMVGAGLAWFWPVFGVLCLSAVLTGAATGSAIIALQRHVGRASHNPTQLKQVFSWLAIGPAVSSFVGPFATGLLIDHAGPTPSSNQGFAAAFAVLAVLPLATWFWIRHTAELPPAHTPHTDAPKRVGDLLRQHSFRRLLLVNWCLASCWDVHTFVVPLLGHERGLSASVIGSILGAFAIAAVIIRVLMPLVAEHLREWAVVTGSMVVTAVLFGIYPLLPSAWAMAMCSVLLGFSLGSVQPMIMSMLHQITPHHRHGEAIGLRMMSINASSVLMPILFGSVGTLIGVSGLFWIVGVSVCLGSRMAWQLGQQPS